MDEQAKTRLILLSISGCLLVVGVVGWLWYNYNFVKLEEKNISTTHPGTLPKVPIAIPSNISYSTNNLVKQPLSPALTIAPPVSQPLMTPPQMPVALSTSLSSGKALLQKLGNMTTASQNIQTNNANQADLIKSTPTSNEQNKNGSVYSAIKQVEAISQAKQFVGRQDPMRSYSNKLPWPLWHKTAQTNIASQQNLIPPPPPNDSLANNNQQRLPADVLPVPPDKPSISQHLQLSAIIGKRAIFIVPLSVRQEINCPATITLSPGEQFESMSLVSVSPDSVIIDENGERKVKALESIK